MYHPLPLRPAAALRAATLALVLAAPLTAPPAAYAEAPIKPAALRPGDTIMMIAPAGELNETRMTLAAKRLREMGFEVIVPDDLFRRRGYNAGTDEQRADELMRAFRDPDVDAIFPGTGGFGVTRMLHLVDWDVVRANPKIVIGFSDITALHLALAAKANLVTFHSPNPQWGLGSDSNLADFSAKYFWRCLLASENEEEQGFTYKLPKKNGPLVPLAPGVGEGTVTGGNLTLVAATLGTPYEIAADGKILFLEDVGEAPYRIDRMLSELRLAGKLDKLSGVVLGQFRGCEDDDDRGGLSLQQVFDDYFRGAAYPVVRNFAAGHVPLNATIPFGVPCRLDADSLTFEVLENPVSVR